MAKHVRFTAISESPSNPPRIGYAGTVRYAETLLPVLRACRKLETCFHIFGDGPVRPRLDREFSNWDGYCFHVRYSVSDVTNILSQLDVPWAAYFATDLNVRHAISNKFYESQLFGIPAVFSSGASLGNLVIDEGIGFAVSVDDEDSTHALLQSFVTAPQQLRSLGDRLYVHRGDERNRLTWDSQEKQLCKWARAILRPQPLPSPSLRSTG